MLSEVRRKGALIEVLGDYAIAKCNCTPEYQCDRMTNCVVCIVETIKERLIHIPGININTDALVFDGCTEGKCNDRGPRELEGKCDEMGGCQHHIAGEIVENAVTFKDERTVNVGRLEGLKGEYIGEALHMLSAPEILGDKFDGRISNKEAEEIMEGLLDDFLLYVREAHGYHGSKEEALLEIMWDAVNKAEAISDLEIWPDVAAFKTMVQQLTERINEGREL